MKADVISICDETCQYDIRKIINCVNDKLITHIKSENKKEQ